MTISGAYGRDYKSKAAIEADLAAGKDFFCRGLDSGYVNVEDLRSAGIRSVTVRYSADRKVAIVKVPQ
jgi:hypothetical protein